MRKQNSKRSRRQSEYRGVSPVIGHPIVNSEPTYLYRDVLEPSVEVLNKATRGIRAKGAVRIVDNFSLTLVYPQKLRRARDYSPLQYPPNMSTMAARLGNVPLYSLRQSVSAAIEGVEQFSDVVGVRVSYPGYEEEQEAFRSEMRDLLQLRSHSEINIGPGRSHVGIVAGRLAVSQMRQIGSRLPDVLELGLVRNVNGPI